MADDLRERAEKIDRTFGEWLVDSAAHPDFTLAAAIESALRAVQREAIKKTWRYILERYSEGLPIGEYETFTDFAKQETEMACSECSGRGVKRWPDWKVHLRHDDGCPVAIRAPPPPTTDGKGGAG